jgi:hypothetical protein
MADFAVTRRRRFRQFGLAIFVNQKKIFGQPSNCVTDFYPTLDRSP